MSNQGKLIEQLFCVYHDTLKKYCMHCFHYQSQYMPYVDDCIQEVFIAALRKEKKTGFASKSICVVGKCLQEAVCYHTAAEGSKS